MSSLHKMNVKTGLFPYLNIGGMRYFVLFICVLWSLNLSAQDSFVEQHDKVMSGFNEFRSSIMSDYESFREKIIKDYCDMLKEAWSQLEAFRGEPLPIEKQLPPVVFPEEDIDKPIQDNLKPIEEVVRPENPQPQPTPVIPVKPIQTPNPQKFSFVFLGTELTIRLDKNNMPILTSSKGEDLAAFWAEICDEIYDAILEDCLNLRENLHLCDWAYLLLLRELGNSVYKDCHDSAVLLMTYLYCRSGYTTRLCYTETGNLCLLYASQHFIYEKSYWQIDGVNFYALDYDGETVYMCPASFPKEKPLSLFMTNSQSLAYAASSPRSLASKRYPDCQATVSVNKNLISFFNTYPASVYGDDIMTRWAMYANTQLEDGVKKMLYPALRDIIQGLSQQDAANVLINWVQTAFVYELDDKVWGHDRAFFAEESLYYPYCDCEDRSILFSRLIRDLLGLDVVLVFYPGHLATAVHFTDDIKGDYIMVEGKKFLICDPTYIGAPIGLTMKGMDNATCKAILLE